MRGAKILITGPTGQVATPIARALAAGNEVWGIARFNDVTSCEGLEKAGIRCQTVDLATGDFTGLPSDFDCVLNMAVAKSGDLGPRPRGQRTVGRSAHGPLSQARRSFCTAPRRPCMTLRMTNRARSAPPSATTTSYCSPRIPSARSPARPSPGARRGYCACQRRSPASTSRIATTAAGRTTTWR